MLAEFIAEKRAKSAATADTYEVALGMLVLWLGVEALHGWKGCRDAQLIVVRRADVIAWRLHLETVGNRGKPYSPASVRLKLDAVRSFYGWAARRCRVPQPGLSDGERQQWRDAAADLEDLDVPRGAQSVTRRALSEDDTARLLQAAADPLDRAVLVLLYASGARVSELASASWHDVEERQKAEGRRGEAEGGATITVHGKTGTRDVEIEAEHWEEFKRISKQLAVSSDQEGKWNGSRPRSASLSRGCGSTKVADLCLSSTACSTGSLAPSASRLATRPAIVATLTTSTATATPSSLTPDLLLGGLNRFQIGRIVRRCARAAGVTVAGLGPHTLRHSHATHAIRAGGAAALPLVGAQLGHRSARTTLGYLSAIGQRGSGQYLKIGGWVGVECQGKAEGQKGRRAEGQSSRTRGGRRPGLRVAGSFHVKQGGKNAIN